MTARAARAARWVAAWTAWAMTWLAASAPAGARSTVRLPYPRAEVWTTAIRLLRVNGNLPIREKDEAAGYLLFDYLDGARSYRASLELVPVPEAAGAASATDVILAIPELPRRFEAGLLARLAQKLREERGPGAQPASPSPGRDGKAAADKDAPAAKPVPDGGLPVRLPGEPGGPP